MADKYSDVDSVMASGRKGFAITPHDSTELALTPKALWVGGAGTVVVRLADDSADITFSGVAAGTLLPSGYVSPLLPAEGGSILLRLTPAGAA